MMVDPLNVFGLFLFMFALGMACGFWIGCVHERDRTATEDSKNGGNGNAD